MMPVIRITDATWDRLKRWAIPLEDTPEDAVRKVLDVAEEQLGFKGISRTSPGLKNKRENKGKLPKGLKTPQQAYRRPIIEALYQLNGSGYVADVLKVVEEKMKPLLTEVDYEKIPSGDIRWRNTAMWERYELVKDGLLKSTSQQGVWELSDGGFKEINNLRKA